MSMRHKSFSRAVLLAVALCSAGFANRAHASIWFVDTSTSIFSNEVKLQRIGIFRDGVGEVFKFQDLTLASLTGVNIPGSFQTVVLTADGFPAGGAPDGLMRDQALNTGLLNPGRGDGVFQPGDQFVEFTFDRPILNKVGVDLFLASITYDFGSSESAPGPYWMMVEGGTPVLIDRAADMDLSPVASMPYYMFLNGGPTSPSDFLATNVQQTGSLGNSIATPRPSIQLIDLSELGVAEGATIQSLRLWDDNASNGNAVYPTMIAAVPEVSAFQMTLFAMAVATLIWRRHSNGRRPAQVISGSHPAAGWHC
jgi:hypothetical protein